MLCSQVEIFVVRLVLHQDKKNGRWEMKKKILSVLVMSLCTGAVYASTELQNVTEPTITGMTQSLDNTHEQIVADTNLTNHSTSVDASIDTLDSLQSHSLQALSDDEMSQVEGQALFSLKREDQNNLSFYKLGIEAEVALNANMKSLQLGCGGDNSAAAGKGAMCDIDISNVSFGCVTNASGVCITLPTTVTNQPKGLDSNNAISNQKNLKDFVLTNPFFQFAIRNADSPATRAVAGIRIGADKAVGPLSFGNLNSFSGYLTGKANLKMLGETDVSPVRYGDARYQDASAFLGLDNAQIIGLPLLAYVDYRDLTVNYNTVSRNNLNVAVVGNRVTQAQIQGAQLGGVVDQIMDSLVVNRSCVRVFGLICGGSLGTAVANGLMGVLKGGVGNYIKGQLAGGLGISTSDLNSYVMPYNLKNVHQIDVDSNTFGIALSREGIKYPGYAQAVPKGWSMYLQDAFTLKIEDKVSSLVSNIASSSNARDGNITLLEPAYRNCYGSLKFC